MHFLQKKQARMIVRGVREVLMLCGLLCWLVTCLWNLLQPLFVFFGEAGRMVMIVALVGAVLLLYCEGQAKRLAGVSRTFCRGITRAASGACLAAGVICLCTGFWGVACLVLGIGLVNLPAND